MREKRVIQLFEWLILTAFISACQRQDTLCLVSTARAGVAYGVYVDAGYAYVTNNDGVIIFDVREPGRPREVERILTGYTKNIFVKNGWAYIASENGLIIVDVSIPTSPQLVSNFNTEGAINHIRIEGTYAYIASSKGLEIVDISNPNAPVQVSHLSGGDAWGIDVYDGNVYLAIPQMGLEVIDVRDPSSPQRIRKVPGINGAWDVYIHEGVAYVGCHASGIRILSLSERESPKIIGRYLDDDGGEALAVWTNGESLYVADNFGIEVLDVSDPTHPYEIGEYDRVNGAHDLYAAGSFIYVAEGRKGLIILEFNKN